jgi:hypothetical protein
MTDFNSTIAAMQDAYLNATPESFEEKVSNNEKKLPKLKKLYKDSLSFEPVMLKSALFRPASGARVTYKEYVEVPSHGTSKVLFCGEELRQDDQRVLLMLLKARAGEEITNVQQFVPRSFVRDVLGWADSGDSVAKLKACIVRLQAARVRVEYADGGLGLYSFVSDAVMSKNDEQWSVWLSKHLVDMFKRHPTYIPQAMRLSLRDGLTSWMLGFIKADACLAPFETADIRAWSASTRYEQKDFNRHMKAALEQLIAAGVVVSYELKGASIKIKKA